MLPRLFERFTIKWAHALTTRVYEKFSDDARLEHREPMPGCELVYSKHSIQKFAIAGVASSFYGLLAAHIVLWARQWCIASKWSCVWLQPINVSAIHVDIFGAWLQSSCVYEGDSWTKIETLSSSGVKLAKIGIYRFLSSNTVIYHGRSDRDQPPL